MSLRQKSLINRVIKFIPLACLVMQHIIHQTSDYVYYVRGDFLGPNETPVSASQFVSQSLKYRIPKSILTQCFLLYLILEAGWQWALLSHKFKLGFWLDSC